MQPYFNAEYRGYTLIKTLINNICDKLMINPLFIQNHCDVQKKHLH